MSEEKALYLRNINSIIKNKFKAACSVKGTTMNRELIQFMKTAVRRGTFPVRERVGGEEKYHLLVDEKLRRDFHQLCFKRDTTMINALETFMEDFAKAAFRSHKLGKTASTKARESW